jgi:hypothetical protein
LGLALTNFHLEPLKRGITTTQSFEYESKDLTIAATLESGKFLSIVFCCFNGLAFVDVKKLKRQEVTTRIDAAALDTKAQAEVRGSFEDTIAAYYNPDPG